MRRYAKHRSLIGMSIITGLILGMTSAPIFLLGIIYGGGGFLTDLFNFRKDTFDNAWFFFSSLGGPAGAIALLGFSRAAFRGTIPSQSHYICLLWAITSMISFFYEIMSDHIGDNILSAMRTGQWDYYKVVVVLLFLITLASLFWAAYLRLPEEQPAHPHPPES